MTVLGFSHIVTEIRDFEKSISYYEKLGYSVEYEISQVVPDEKRSVINQNPSEVNLYYLRHKKSPRIGIELIKHNESSEGKRAKNIAHGWSFADSQVSLAKDPDENALIEFPYLGKGPKQHLFIHTSKSKESLDFSSRDRIRRVASIDVNLTGSYFGVQRPAHNELSAVSYFRFSF